MFFLSLWPLVCITSIALFLVFAFLFDHQLRLRERTINEVGDLMRKPDYEQIELLFTPRRENNSSLMDDPLFFGDRRTRRAELDRLQEQYRRFYHNSQVNKEWADTEWRGMLQDPEGEMEGVRDRVGPLREAATESRNLLLLALAVIWFWSLIHFLQLDRLKILSIPEPAALRRLFGLDVLESYARLKDAVSMMKTLFGEESCEAIVTRM